MAQGFNLTAQINLRGPANLRTIVADIRRQLGTVSANVNIRLSSRTARNIRTINQSLQQLNKTLTNTRTLSSQAVTALNTLNRTSTRFGTAMSSIPKNVNSVSSAVNNLSNNNKGLAANTAKARTEFEEFGRQSALAVRRFAALAFVTGGIYRLNNAIASGAKQFVTFNKELIRVSQVTGTSAKNLDFLVSGITNLSTSLGVTSEDLIGISATLAQAGLSARDTEKALKALALSALAPSFDNLSNTVEGSIALMRQFGISAQDLEKALGSVNAVAARFAVEAGDIIAAVQRTGGVFAAASRGVSEGTDALNEFIAVFTSVRATTRESAETIATGLRTIFTRIQRGSTINALKEYGIVLTDLEGKFVGPFEAVKRLAAGLNLLDPRDLRFSRIVEELGGFRQIGKVIPLIQQFTTAQQALIVAQKGQGSLATDAAVAQQALAVRLSKVREEFVALIRSIGQSEGFQNFISLSLDLASALIKIADSAKAILPALTAIAAIKGASFLTQFATGFVGGLRKRGATPSGYATGGLVPGSGDRDTVPAMLTPGEFVIRKKAVKAIGVNNLANMNQGGAVQKFSGGGKSSGIQLASQGRGNPEKRGSRFTFKHLDKTELRKLTTKQLIKYARDQAAAIFSTGGAGLEIGKEFVVVPPERIIPELEPHLITRNGKKGFLRPKIARFGSPAEKPQPKSQAQIRRERFFDKSRELLIYASQGIMHPRSALSAKPERKKAFAEVGPSIVGSYERSLSATPRLKSEGSQSPDASSLKPKFIAWGKNPSGGVFANVVSGFENQIRSQLTGANLETFNKLLKVGSLSAYKAAGGKDGHIPPLKKAIYQIIGITSKNAGVKKNMGGIIQRFEVGKEVKKLPKYADPERVEAARAKSSVRTFGLAGLLGEAGKESYFNKTLVATPQDMEPVPVNIQVGTVAKSDPELSTQVDAYLKKSFKHAIKRTTKFLGTKINATPTGKINLDEIVENSGYQQVAGSVFEGALGNLGAPFFKKTESTKALDFPKGLGASAKFFGISPEAPADATRTVGKGGKGPGRMIGQIERFLEAESQGLYEDVGKSVELPALQKALSTKLSKTKQSAQDIANQLNSQIKQSGVFTVGKTGIPATVTATDVKAIQEGDEKVINRTINRIVGKKADPRKRQALYDLLSSGGFEFKATGGSVQDTVPALLTPGEFVINKKAASRIGASRLNQLNRADRIKGFNKGGSVGFVQKFAKGGSPQKLAEVVGSFDPVSNEAVKALEDATESLITKIVGDIAKANPKISFDDAYNIAQQEVQPKASFGLMRAADTGDQKAANMVADMQRKQVNSLIKAIRANDKSISITQAKAAAERKVADSWGGLYKRTKEQEKQAGLLSRAMSRVTGLYSKMKGPQLTEDQIKQRDEKRARLNSVLSSAGTAIAFTAPMLGQQLGESIGGTRGAGISEAATSLGTFAGIGSQFGVIGTLIGGLAGLVAAIDGYTKGILKAENEIDKKDIEREAGRAERTVERLSKNPKDKVLTDSLIDSLNKMSAKEEDIKKRNMELRKPSMMQRTGAALQTTASYLTFGLVSEGRAGPPQMGTKEYKKYISEIGQEDAAQSRARADNALKALTAKGSQGLTLDQAMASFGSGASAIQESIASGNVEYATELAKLTEMTAKGFITAAELDQRKKSLIQKYFAEETETIKAAMADAARAKAAQKVAKALNTAVTSIDRTFGNMEAALNRGADALSKASMNIEAMANDRSVLQASFSGQNILENPRAYSRQQRLSAVQQSSSIFGRDAAFVEKLAGSTGSEIKDALTSIGVRAQQTGQSKETTAIEVQRTVDDKLMAAFGNNDLTRQLSQQIKLAIEGQLKNNETDELDIDKLLSETSGLTSLIESEQKAFQLLAQATKQVTQAVDIYSSQLSRATEMLNEADNLRAESIARRASNDFRLREILGETNIPVEERIAARRDESAARAGIKPDQLNTGFLLNRLATLRQTRTGVQTQREEFQRGRDFMSPETIEGINRFNASLVDLDNEINKTKTALKALPQDIQGAIDDVASAMQNRLSKVEGMRQAGAGFGEKLVTSTPEEFANLGTTYNILNNALNGQVRTIQQSVAAQQAYQKTIKDGGNAVEAMSAAQNAFANENRQAFAMFSELVEVSGMERQQANNMRADLLLSMARSQGLNVQNNPFFSKIIESLRKAPEDDPEIKRLQTLYKQLQETQQKALEANRQIVLEDSASLIKSAGDVVKQAIESSRISFNEQQLSDIGLGLSRPGQVMNKSEGGVVYASAGKLINFKPKGTDTVPAMLTPGEFVVNAKATKQNLPLLQSINKSSGGIVQYFANGTTRPVSMSRNSGPIIRTSGDSQQFFDDLMTSWGSPVNQGGRQQTRPATATRPRPVQKPVSATYTVNPNTGGVSRPFGNIMDYGGLTPDELLLEKQYLQQQLNLLKDPNGMIRGFAATEAQKIHKSMQRLNAYLPQNAQITAPPTALATTAASNAAATPKPSTKTPNKPQKTNTTTPKPVDPTPSDDVKPNNTQTRGSSKPTRNRNRKFNLIDWLAEDGSSSSTMTPLDDDAIVDNWLKQGATANSGRASRTSVLPTRATFGQRFAAMAGDVGEAGSGVLTRAGTALGSAYRGVKFGAEATGSYIQRVIEYANAPFADGNRSRIPGAGTVRGATRTVRGAAKLGVDATRAGFRGTMGLGRTLGTSLLPVFAINMALENAGLGSLSNESATMLSFGIDAAGGAARGVLSSPVTSARGVIPQPALARQASRLSAASRFPKPSPALSRAVPGSQRVTSAAGNVVRRIPGVSRAASAVGNSRAGSAAARTVNAVRGVGSLGGGSVGTGFTAARGAAASAVAVNTALSGAIEGVSFLYDREGYSNRLAAQEESEYADAQNQSGLRYAGGQALSGFTNPFRMFAKFGRSAYSTSQTTASLQADQERYDAKMASDRLTLGGRLSQITSRYGAITGIQDNATGKIYSPYVSSDMRELDEIFMSDPVYMAGGHNLTAQERNWVKTRATLDYNKKRGFVNKYVTTPDGKTVIKKLSLNTPEGQAELQRQSNEQNAARDAKTTRYTRGYLWNTETEENILQSNQLDQVAANLVTEYERRDEIKRQAEEEARIIKEGEQFISGVNTAVSSVMSFGQQAYNFGAGVFNSATQASRQRQAETTRAAEREEKKKLKILSHEANNALRRPALPEYIDEFKGLSDRRQQLMAEKAALSENLIPDQIFNQFEAGLISPERAREIVDERKRKIADLDREINSINSTVTKKQREGMISVPGEEREKLWKSYEKKETLRQVREEKKEQDRAIQKQLSAYSDLAKVSRMPMPKDPSKLGDWRMKALKRLRKSFFLTGDPAADIENMTDYGMSPDLAQRLFRPLTENQQQTLYEVMSQQRTRKGSYKYSDSDLQLLKMSRKDVMQYIVSGKARNPQAILERKDKLEAERENELGKAMRAMGGISVLAARGMNVNNETAQMRFRKNIIRKLAKSGYIDPRDPPSKNAQKLSAYNLNPQVVSFVYPNQQGGMLASTNRSSGGLIYASKGKLINFQPKGTDTVPAMLTPGEFVVNARATKQHLPMLQAINKADGGFIGSTEGTVVSNKIRTDQSQKAMQQKSLEKLQQIDSRTNSIDSVSAEIKNEEFPSLYNQTNNFAENTSGGINDLNNLSQRNLTRTSNVQSYLEKNNTGGKLDSILNCCNKNTSLSLATNALLMDQQNIAGLPQAAQWGVADAAEVARQGLGAMFGNMFSRGGMVYASRGMMIPYQPRGTDTVPAMLTPGEFVVNNRATRQHLPLLKQINSGNSISATGFMQGGLVPPQYARAAMVAGRKAENARVNVRSGQQLQNTATDLSNFLSQYTNSEAGLDKLNSIRRQDYGITGVNVGSLPGGNASASLDAMYTFNTRSNAGQLHFRQNVVDQGLVEHEMTHGLQNMSFSPNGMYLTQESNRLFNSLDLPKQQSIISWLRDSWGWNLLNTYSYKGRNYSSRKLMSDAAEILPTLVQSRKIVDEFRSKTDALPMFAKTITMYDDALKVAMEAHGFNSGGPVYASVGKLINYKPRGTDTVPAMLTPGEFVVNRSATQKNLPLLKAINGGATANFAGGGRVNYMADGGLLGQVFQPVISSFTSLTTSISKAIQALQTYQKQLAGTQPNSVSNSGNTAKTLNFDELSRFTQKFDQFIAAVNSINIPPIVRLQVEPVTVNITGAEALTRALEGPLGDMLQGQLADAMGRLSASTEGAIQV